MFKIIENTFRIILIGSFVFLFVFAITISKSLGISKTVILPFYGQHNVAFIHYFLYFFSVVGFVWLIKKDFIYNYIKIFSFSFAISLSLVFSYVYPFNNFMIGNYISFFERIGVTTEKLGENKFRWNLLGYYNSNPYDFVNLYFNKSVDEIYLKDIPFVAIRFEFSENTDHHEYAKKLWTHYYNENTLLFDDRIELNNHYIKKYFLAFQSLFNQYNNIEFVNRRHFDHFRSRMMIAHNNRFEVLGDTTNESYQEIYESIHALYLNKIDFNFTDFNLKEIKKRALNTYIQKI